MSKATDIKNSWSINSFKEEFGSRISLAPFVNKESGECFIGCVFRNGDTKTFVSFSKKLNMPQAIPEVAKRLKEEKDNLQIVENLSKEGKTVYTMCSIGENAWIDIDL